MCHSAGDATHLFPEHGVHNANYPIEHDIFSPSTVKFLIAPEYRCNRALPYGLVQRLMTVLRSWMTTYLDPLAQ
jgi:hypothetical protein